jgi:hypothetical protein
VQNWIRKYTRTKEEILFLRGSSNSVQNLHYLQTEGRFSMTGGELLHEHISRYRGIAALLVRFCAQKIWRELRS